MTTKTGSSGPLWLDLGAPAVIAASGAEARRFCNGMFTNNVRDLPIGGANRSAIVDDRGRIGGFLDLLCEADDRFLLVVEGLDAAGFLERFEKYAMLDDVELAVRTGLALLSVQGPAIDLAAAGLPVPEPGRYAGAEPRIWRRVRSPAGGFDVLAADRAAAAEALGRIAAPGTGEDAEILRIAAGRPKFPADTGDKRLPAEIGLRDELLSFDKGCYLGQESINRIDVMGDVKRKLVGIRVSDAPAAGGDAVELTSSARLPSGDTIGLAVVHRPHDAPGTAVSVGGRAGVVEAFPLALE